MRFTCRATLQTADSRSTFRIDHDNSLRGHRATTTATVRDAAGLRDLIIVGIACNDDEIASFFFIDGESPDGQRVAILINEEEGLAQVGCWQAEGRTLEELATADKTTSGLAEATKRYLYFMTFPD
jgi:hypothetical protein